MRSAGAHPGSRALAGSRPSGGRSPSGSAGEPPAEEPGAPSESQGATPANEHQSSSPRAT